MARSCNHSPVLSITLSLGRSFSTMSPDLDWRIGEDAEEETIAKTPRRARSRWHSFAVMLVTCAGVGLGIVYSSIPEPPPRPVPTPAMTPRPLSTPSSTDDHYASYRQLVTVIERFHG